MTRGEDSTAKKGMQRTASMHRSRSRGGVGATSLNRSKFNVSTASNATFLGSKRANPRDFAKAD
jgi:hypothetical protein